MFFRSSNVYLPLGHPNVYSIELHKNILIYLIEISSKANIFSRTVNSPSNFASITC